MGNLLNGSIYRAPMADLSRFAPMPLVGLIHPTAVDYDPITDTIYWSDQGGYGQPSSISKANIDGTEQQILQQGIGGKTWADDRSKIVTIF